MLRQLKNFLNGSRDGKLWGVLRWCYIRLFSHSKRFNRGACYLRHMQQLSSKIQQAAQDIKADVYVVGEPESLFAALEYKKKYGGKIVWFIREHPFRLRRLQPWIPYSKQEVESFQQLELLTRQCMSEIDLCLCTGEGYAKWCRDLGLKTLNANFYFNFSKKSFSFASLRERLGLTNDARLIIYPCSIYTATDIKTLVRVLSELPENFYLIHLGLFRPVALRKQLQNFAKKQGAFARLHLLEPLPRKQMLSAVSASDIGLVDLDPRVEGCFLGVHNRFVDLMEAGVPFVYSENISMRHLHPEQRWAVEYRWGDVGDLKQKLLNLVDKKPLLQGEIKKAVESIAESNIQTSDEWNAIFKGARKVSFIDTIILPQNTPSMQLAKKLIDQGIKVSMIYKRLGWWTQLQTKVVDKSDFN